MHYYEKNGIVPVFSDIDCPNGYGGYGKNLLLQTYINSGKENLAVRYENMIGLLVEAIKELKTEVEELKKGK